MYNFDQYKIRAKYSGDMINSYSISIKVRAGHSCIYYPGKRPQMKDR